MLDPSKPQNLLKFYERRGTSIATPVSTSKTSETHTDTASEEDTESRKSKNHKTVEKGKTNKFALRMARHMHMAGGSTDKSHHGSDARQSSMDETSSSHSHVSSQHAAYHQ